MGSSSGPDLIAFLVLAAMTVLAFAPAIFPRPFLRLARWSIDVNNRLQSWFGMRTVIDDEGRFERSQRWAAGLAAAAMVLLTFFAMRAAKTSRGGAGELQALAQELLRAWAPEGDLLPLADGTRGPRRVEGADGKEYIGSFMLRRLQDGRIEAGVVVTGPRGERAWASRVSRR